MAIRDYSDDPDFYTQGFAKENTVSIWVGQTTNENDPEGLDVLQDLCGVGYYDLDNQDANCYDFKEVSLRTLLEGTSYSSSFLDLALSEASKRGLLMARWVILQYDFEYDPAKVERQVAPDPVFLGAFPYSVK